MSFLQRVVTVGVTSSLALGAAVAPGAASTFVPPPECSTLSFDGLSIAELLVWKDRCHSPFHRVRVMAKYLLAMEDPQYRGERIAAYLDEGRDHTLAKIEHLEKHYERRIERLLRTFPKRYYPSLHQLGELALKSGFDVKQEFVSGGAQAAREADVLAREQMDEEKSAHLLAEVQFIQTLASESPNDFVRFAAQRALDDSPDPQAIGAFFSSAWPTALADGLAYEKTTLFTLNFKATLHLQRLESQVRELVAAAEKLDGAAKEQALRDAKEVLDKGLADGREFDSQWEQKRIAVEALKADWAALLPVIDQNAQEHWAHVRSASADVSTQVADLSAQFDADTQDIDVVTQRLERLANTLPA